MQSLKGRQMMQYISPALHDSKIEQAIYEAIGSEFDSLEEAVADVKLQLFPQTATWGLAWWEKRLGLQTNLSEDLEKRRKKVIVKLQTRWPMTPLNMANIISTYTSADVHIIENVAPYTFEVDLLSNNGFPEDLIDLYKTVKRIKPSHEGVRYKLTSITNMNIYYAAASISGETITVYPWTPKSIESRGTINLATASANNTETISVYPKEG
ncbi:YmfQ family protein [Clostridium sp. LBM24168]